MKPYRAFWQQRRNATLLRGISWELTFDQWWSLWSESGHWPERGSGDGKYCMCRKGDIGPYAVGNVFIGSFSQNAADARKTKAGLPLGVRKTKYGGYEAARGSRGVRYYLGTFDTPDLAHSAYLNFAEGNPA